MRGNLQNYFIDSELDGILKEELSNNHFICLFYSKEFSSYILEDRYCDERLSFLAGENKEEALLFKKEYLLNYSPFLFVKNHSFSFSYLYKEKQKYYLYLPCEKCSGFSFYMADEDIEIKTLREKARQVEKWFASSEGPACAGCVNILLKNDPPKTALPKEAHIWLDIDSQEWNLWLPSYGSISLKLPSCSSEKEVQEKAKLLKFLFEKENNL